MLPQSLDYMHEILQVLSLSLFEKKPMLQAFSDDPLTKEDDSIHNQLSLFNFWPGSSGEFA